MKNLKQKYKSILAGSKKKATEKRETVISFEVLGLVI